MHFPFLSRLFGGVLSHQRYAHIAGVLLLCGLSVAAQDLTAEANAAIEKHRKGVLVIEAAPNTEVVVEQLRHEFWFGAALSNQMFSGRARPEEAERYRATFLANFNSAVTENALKWHSMEARRGSVDYATVDAILKWTDQHQLPLRGHNIYWGVPNSVQDWQKQLSDTELREVLKNRGLDVGRRYRGRFAEYDLNNEMIHGNYYETRLGKDITKQMADWVREGDPAAVLYLNDYDILTGVMLNDYVKHIQELLDQGVPIGGIGVQGHLHGDSFDASVLRSSLKKLAEFKLPIRVTEFNMPGQRSKFYKDRKLKPTEADENAKAAALVEYYRICFAEPQVEGILMWGFWEGANWIPASSLFAKDWTPLPAAKAYRDLVFNQWWTKWRGHTDAQGRCEVRAFYGKHRVSVGGKEVVADLKRTDGTTKVLVKSDAKTSGKSENALAAGLETVRIAPDQKGFILHPSGDRFVPWGHNYASVDIMERLATDPERVAREFAEMKAAGTTVARIHPEMPQILSGPDQLAPHAIEQLKKLLTIAADSGIRLKITGLACYKIKDRMGWYDALAEQERWQTQAFFWESIARCCGDHPAVFAYDLVNEPGAIGKRADGWYLGKMGEVEFCQRLSLNPGNRNGDEIFRDWTKRMVAAIRKHDQAHLISMGMLPFPGAYKAVSEQLDFVSPHLYPKTGKVDDEIKLLKQFDWGKPIVLGETFPLSCGADDERDFLLKSRDFAHGWIGHWPDESPAKLAELKETGKATIHSAIWLSWVNLFKELGPQMTDGLSPR